MAYTGNTLSVITQTIEGYFHVYVYITFDTIAEVLATGYVSDGTERGMLLGDFVFAVIGGVPYMLYVSAVSGEACTLSSVAVFINGADLPVINPGVGSGELWNNGGVVCVA
jgi:hypothetical protein